MTQSKADDQKDENDDQFLPEVDQEPDEGEMHISPALRALMAKYEVTYFSQKIELLLIVYQG